MLQISRVIRWSVLLAAALFTASLNAKPYKAGEIYSKQTYKYGCYEVRMKVAKGSGVLSTFFTYKNGSEIGNTFWEEIDIEIFGKNNATQWQSNVIIGSNRPTTKTEGVHTASASLATVIILMSWNGRPATSLGLWMAAKCAVSMAGNLSPV